MTISRLETPGNTWFTHREVLLQERLKEALNRDGLYPTTPPWFRYSRINAKKQQLRQLDPNTPQWVVDQVAASLVDSEEHLKEMRKLYDLEG